MVYEERSIGIPGVHSVGKYNYVAAREGLPSHQHIGCVEINLLVKGYQTYQLGDQTYRLKGGEQYISLPGELHDSGSAPQEKGILYWLILDVTKFQENFLLLAPDVASSFLMELLRFPSRHFSAHSAAHDTLDLAFQALGEIQKPDECTGIFQKELAKLHPPKKTDKRKAKVGRDQFQLLGAANHVIRYILQTLEASRASVRTTLPIIQDSLHHIAQNQEVWLSVAQLAEKVNLSESYFKILFREEVGLPPAEYMLRQKVEAAKSALSNPEANITDLAFQLGFSSSQYFATVFRRFTNQTPTEFMTAQI